MVRIWLCGLIAIGVWWLSLHARAQPEPLGMDAPAIQFSAARADATLGRLLDGQHPHPVGSAEDRAVHARLLKELQSLGIAARTQTQMSCFTEPRWGAVECGTITNIVAPLSPGEGKSVLLMAHMDSVAAGPGAADDGSGVATILETARALKARGLSGNHPVTLLFTDGEEAGMLGAAAYARNARAGIGMVVNMEARGNQGSSLLFQTSPGNGRLIDLYARSLPHYAASSLYGEIYKYLPNDTDLSPMLQAGLPGLNFAFVGDVAQYHTALDRRENLAPASLQSHGENALESVDALSHADFSALKGEDAIYLDIMGRWLPRLRVSLALPLSLAALLAIVLAGLLTRRERREILRPYTSFLMPPLLLALAVGMGFVLHGLAAWISGNADPSFAHPVWLRLSLAFGVFAAALLAARGAGPIAGWLWLSGLAVACAWKAPGVTPYFLYPALVAAPLLLATIRGGRTVALWGAAAAGLVVWLGLTARAEDIMGLKLHELFTVSAGFGLVALLPLLARARGGALALCFAASLLLAVALAVTAGLQPAFSAAAPQRLNILYVQQDGRAWWLADPVARLPDSLRAVANFSAQPQKLVDTGYVAPAGDARLAVPAASVSREGDVVTLDVEAPGADGIEVRVPQAAALQSVSLGGVLSQAPRGKPVSITCVTPDCGKAQLVLSLATPGPVSLELLAVRRGLPPGGAKLQKARPGWTVTSQEGDVSLSAIQIEIPAP
ncbi:MAG TPA: M20/M25/M40 family metallo-hydrolase [Rhizomicrobium sp.]|nr:M20/M25/M40 family metallo-hydrolase [Rhizomicrobium sp.]